MRCCVPFCESSTEDVIVSPSTTKQISFYAFPRSPPELASWLRALGMRGPVSACAAVCSRHFLQEDMCGESLRAGAVPTTVQVCMICLDTDSKMFSMSSYNLEEAYKHLTGYALFDVGNLKHTLCVECAQRLTNFDKFRDKSLRARALMMDLVKQHEVITIRDIAALRSLKSPLAQRTCEPHLLQISADEQAGVNTEPDMHMAWDSVEVKTEPDLHVLQDRADEQAEVNSLLAQNTCESYVLQVSSYEQAEVKTEPDLHVLQDSAAEQAEVSAESDLHMAWVSADEQAEVKTEPAPAEDSGDGTAEPLRCPKLLRCRVLLTRMSRTEECGEHTCTGPRTSRASEGCSAAVATVPARLATKEQNMRPANTDQDETYSPHSNRDEAVAHDETSHNSDCNTHERCTNTPANCSLETTRDVLTQSEKVAPEQGGSPTVTRTSISFSDCDTANDTASVDFDQTSQDESPTSTVVEAVTARTTVDKDSSNIDAEEIGTTENIVRSRSGKRIEERCYICDVCQHKFKHKNLLVKHIVSHAEAKPFSCLFCQYRCKYKCALVRHVRIHTGEKPFACQLCSYKCRDKRYIAIHMKTHTDEKPFACEICQYRCRVKNQLMRHMRTHTGEKPFACDVCQYRCSVKSSLVLHMRTHSGKKPYACKLCSYKCLEHSHLIQHMRTHTGEKPFACKLCHRKFSGSSHLVRHMKTHTGEKPFVCKLCPFKCIENSGLVKHMRAHTGEKPFACKLCQYKCAQSSTLTQHMRTHTGEKPFACKLCRYKCAQQSNLICHMKIHTDE